MISLIPRITGRSVLFLTTKNLDYIRNSQEIALLKKYAAFVHVIGSKSPSYPRRLLSVWGRLLFLPMRRYDVVFAGFAPQLIVPLFSFKFRGRFLIEDFFISFYDTLVFDRKKFSPKSLPARLLHRLDERTIKRADLVVSDTDAHGAYFASEFQKDPAMLGTLYLQADPRIYYPRKVPSQKPDGFLVLYFGSILPLQGLPVILRAIKRLADCPGIRFVLIGPIPDTAEKPAGDNIRYLSWLPQEALAEEIAKADLCLAGHFDPDIQKARRTIPGKAYIYEAMGKPMILGDNPANREREGLWKVPVSYVPMGDDTALADCIRDHFLSYSNFRR